MKAKDFFVLPSGIRAGWRFLLWWAIALTAAGVILAVWALFHPKPHAFLDPVSLIAGDILTAFIPAAVATFVMARVEHRTLQDYYVPTRQLFGSRFWVGVAYGFAAVSLLIGGITAMGGYSIRGLAANEHSLAYSFLIWVAAALVIGIVEEFTFRAYQLRTLADGIGFWPAAILLSISFGALHYFTKPYERWEDFASTGLLGLFGCFTIQRTRSITFLIGFHAAFDWSAMYFYSGRNAGEFAIARLFETAWTGSDRLTGGMLGPEASWLVFPVIALLFVAFHFAYRRGPVAMIPASETTAVIDTKQGSA